MLVSDFVRAAVVFSLQNWLAETPEQRRKATTPGYFGVGMSCALLLLIIFLPIPAGEADSVAVLAVIVTYIPLFLPPQQMGTIPTDTTAPRAIPI